MCAKSGYRSFTFLGHVASFVTREAEIFVCNSLIFSLYDQRDIAWSNLPQQDSIAAQPFGHLRTGSKQISTF